MIDADVPDMKKAAMKTASFEFSWFQA